MRKRCWPKYQQEPGWCRGVTLVCFPNDLGRAVYCRCEWDLSERTRCIKWAGGLTEMQARRWACLELWPLMLLPLARLTFPIPKNQVDALVRLFNPSIANLDFAAIPFVQHDLVTSLHEWGAQPDSPLRLSPHSVEQALPPHPRSSHPSASPTLALPPAHPQTTPILAPALRRPPSRDRYPFTRRPITARPIHHTRFQSDMAAAS